MKMLIFINWVGEAEDIFNLSFASANIYSSRKADWTDILHISAFIQTWMEYNNGVGLSWLF